MKRADSRDKKQLLDTLLQAKQGDQAAFTQLAQQYHPLLSSLVSASIGEIPHASSDYEDLYQEALILFYRALSSYDTEQEDVEFGLYAKICIHNGLKTQIKKLQRRIPLMPLETEEKIEMPKERPEDRLIETENYQTLCTDISATLTPYENRVWWLYLSGRTAKEIATLLQKDEKSVQNAIFRIRRKLRTVIPHP